MSIKSRYRKFRQVCIILLLLAGSFAAGASRATVDQGIVQFQRGAYEKSLEIFREAYTSGPPATNVFAAVSLFMIIRCDYELGNYDRVINDSRTFERIFSDSRYLPDVLFERGKALAMKKQFFPAMHSAIRVLSLSEDDKLKQNIMSFCSDLSRYYLQPSDMEMLSSLVIGEESLTYLKLIWAERNIMLADFTGAGRLLQEVKTELTNQAYVDKYKELVKYLNKSNKAEDPEINIAVVLPLTGKYSETGNELLDGIKYAYESTRNKSKKRVSIVIVDTESKVQSGLKNLKQLLEMQNISAVIGPLTSEMAISMAPLCEYAGVPIIAPTATADNLTDMGTSIFQLNPEQQQRASSLANYATDSLGYRRFAIIAPTSEYGIDISNAFARSVEKNGAKVIYKIWYNETPTDINDKLKELKDGAEYLPDYFSYLDGYYEARAAGFFDIDTITPADTLETAFMDSIFVDSPVFDTTLTDSLYAVTFEDTLVPPDTNFILEELWPDDTTIYEILLYGTRDDSVHIPADSILKRLKKHAGNWMSGKITLEEKYNTIITDSICVLLDAQDKDEGELLIARILNDMDDIVINDEYLGEFKFSPLFIDRAPLAPYIDLALVDSLTAELSVIDSIDALWLLSKTDPILFPYLFPYENYGIQAVYIPIPQHHIQYIAPQWAKNRFDAYLMGDGNWYNTNLLNRYRSNIDSMLIASDYYWDSKDIELRRFSKYFTQKTDIQPNRIHIYGYESMALLLDIIENGGDSAYEIRERLKTLEGTYGIIRRIQFSPDKPRSSSGVRLIRFYKGKLTPID